MVELKCCLIGSSEVGKTFLFNTFFNLNTTKISSTIGPTSQTHIIKFEKQSIKIKFLDTSGQEKIRSVSRGYFKNSNGILLMFDLNNRKTFEDLEGWIKDVSFLCDSEVSILLVGNNKNLLNKRQVTKREAENFANKFNLKYVEINSPDKHEINSIIDLLINNIIKTIFQKSFLKKPNRAITLSKATLKQFNCNSIRQ
jgi:small GTP-binding protein